jgi:hypothetical protein
MRLAIATLIVALGVGTAAAEIRTSQSGKVSVDIPSSWTVKSDKTGLLVGQSKDDAVGLMFWVVDKFDVTESLEKLDAAVKGKITKIKWETAKKAEINGLKGIRNVGTAEIKGKPAVLMLAIVGPTPSNKGVIIFGAIEQSKLTEHKAELVNVLDSLKPIK